jgi:pimeloyl-ACP methyl ester carboxylesterase
LKLGYAPDKIVLVGDSAGGNLALATAARAGDAVCCCRTRWCCSHPGSISPRKALLTGLISELVEEGYWNHNMP